MSSEQVQAGEFISHDAPTEEMGKQRGQQAIEVAEKIGKAIVDKFPKHQLFVRRTDLNGVNGFVEIALRPDNGGYNQEITCAYSDSFYTRTDMTLKEKAKRIYDDFKVHFGLK